MPLHCKHAVIKSGFDAETEYSNYFHHGAKQMSCHSKMYCCPCNTDGCTKYTDYELTVSRNTTRV